MKSRIYSQIEQGSISVSAVFSWELVEKKKSKSLHNWHYYYKHACPTKHLETSAFSIGLVFSLQKTGHKKTLSVGFIYEFLLKLSVSVFAGQAKINIYQSLNNSHKSL